MPEAVLDGRAVRRNIFQVRWKRNQVEGRCDVFLFLEAGTVAGHGSEEILSAIRYAAVLIALRRLEVVVSSSNSMRSSNSHSAMMIPKSLFRSCARVCRSGPFELVFASPAMPNDSLFRNHRRHWRDSCYENRKQSVAMLIPAQGFVSGFFTIPR